jgi:hypothetical protein
MLWLHYERDQNYGKLIKNALTTAKAPKGKIITRPSMSELRRAIGQVPYIREPAENIIA